MTTATYTQGLQAMYPSLQQIPGQVPVQQYGPQYMQPFAQQHVPQYAQQHAPQIPQQFGQQSGQQAPQQFGQQFGQQAPQQSGMQAPFAPQAYAPQFAPQFGQQFGQQHPLHQQQATAAGLYGQKIHRQQIAAELFRLAQLVQYSSQFVGPQPGKPSRVGIAVELHKLAQQVEQSIQAQQSTQQQAPYGVPMQGPAWA
jgi:hypothetical protein